MAGRRRWDDDARGISRADSAAFTGHGHIFRISTSVPASPARPG